MDFEFTNNLALPLLLPNQSGKEITHNEALIILDNIVQNSVIDDSISTPPANPNTNDMYIIGDNAVDEWMGKENCLAFYDNGWNFVEPKEGFTFFLKSSQYFVTFNGENWEKTLKETKFSNLTDVSLENPIENDLIKYDGENFVNVNNISINNIVVKNSIDFNNGSDVEKFKIQLNDEENLTLNILNSDNEQNENIVVDGITGRVNFKYGIDVNGTNLENLLGGNISQEDLDGKLETSGANITDSFYRRITPNYNSSINFDGGFVAPSNGLIIVYSTGTPSSSAGVIHANGKEIGYNTYNTSFTFNVKKGDVITFTYSSQTPQYRRFYPFYDA
jgi:hypothetical protein